MQLTIIRHGKVNMQWKKWSTSTQFDADCSNYDIAPLYPMEETTEQNVSAEIYVSTLKRSRETAERLFGQRKFTETDLLNEVPLRSFCDCSIRLPLWLWNVTGRMQWLLQNKRQAEGIRETKQRADTLIERLLQKNGDCILVSHGFFMRTLVKELKRYGFKIDRKKIGFANLERIVAVR